ncbi:MAG TPA: lysophospholipid acyltransferase family protein [Gemmatimonadales bacterium]
MALYAIFRGLARVSLRWFYRDVSVVGREHVPPDGPLLIAVNHPNALVDALAAVSVVPRRVTLTAKATLWENPFLAMLLPRVGIVPLRRAQDERKRLAADAAANVVREDASTGAGMVVASAADGAILQSGGAPRPPGGAAPGEVASTGAAPTDSSRNEASFAALLDVLDRGGAVLIFPEGKSHSEPQLAPLRTGLARIALQARDGRAVRGLRVLPIGLVFERKWQPRSRVLVQVGEPLDLDGWSPPPGDRPVEALTREVATRLRAVTLNFETAGEEARTMGVARALAAAFDGSRPLGSAETPLESAVAVAQRVEAARRNLSAGGALPPRAEQFLARLATLRRDAARHHVMLEDAEIATGLLPGARFTVREGLLLLLALPVALWGAVNHLLPLRLAWWLARRRSRNLDEPAMHTIVGGLALVLLFYALQGAVVAWLAGPWWAAAYLATLPPAGVVELRTRDRLRRALRRARTYRLFRRDPALRQHFAAELAWLREEAMTVEKL